MALAAVLFIWPAFSLGAPCDEFLKYGNPSDTPQHSSDHLVFLCRKGYALAHSPDCKEPVWVAEHLLASRAKKVKRSDDFRPDPDLKEGERSELSDYKGSDYDRGHMAPAEDMSWDATAMSQSFLLSNMSPQVGVGFNQHIWKTLEMKVRLWAKLRGELYVFTGPIYASEDIKRTHDSPKGVCIPTHYYKIIYDPVRFEAIAFVLPNAKLVTKDLPNYIVSIDHVEELTDLDFLKKLKKSVQKHLEAAVQPRLWPTN
ncbi:MAG: DNA/RNA non-specific endonuclease [Candidatus Coatesbacteria bacterium]